MPKMGCCRGAALRTQEETTMCLTYPKKRRRQQQQQQQQQQHFRKHLGRPFSFSIAHHFGGSFSIHVAFGFLGKSLMINSCFLHPLSMQKRLRGHYRIIEIVPLAAETKG